MKQSQFRTFILLFGLLAALATVFVSGCGGGGGGGGGNITPSPSPTATRFTLTASVQGEGSLEPPSGSEYESGAVVTLTPVPAQNWLFSEWAGPDGDEVSGNKITMDSDKSVTAVFVRPAYDLTVNVQGQGAVDQELVSKDREEYQKGEKVKLTATPSVGWVFVRWEGDLTGSENPATITVDEDKTVTAVFEIATTYVLDDSWGVNGQVTGFTYPRGLAMASNGDLYVTDHTIVRTISADGSTVTDWIYSFTNPMSVCIGSGGNILVADKGVSTVEIFSAPDNHSSTFAGTGINSPIGVDVDSSGNVFVAEFLAVGTVKKFAPAGGAPSATWTTDGTTAFNFCSNVFIDEYDNMYASNLGGHVVSVFNSAGTFVEQLPLYQPAVAPLAGPVDVAMDSGGFVYVVDANKDLIVKITPSGAVHPVAGGILDAPQEIVVDSVGNLYVVDMNNGRVVRLKPAPTP